MSSTTTTTVQASSIPPWKTFPRSESAYKIQAGDADTILNIAAYPRRDHDNWVIKFPDSVHDLFDALIPSSTKFRQCIPSPDTDNENDASSVPRGLLSRLPLELLQLVFLFSDMSTIFQLRQTNLRLRSAVDSLPQFQAIVAHGGANAFCALLRTEFASYVTLSDFYAALVTQDCSLCGRYAGTIFLPAWLRCCHECMLNARETGMVPLATIKRDLPYLVTRGDPSTSSLPPLPRLTMSTLPGTYEGYTQQGGTRIVHVQPVISAVMAAASDSGGKKPFRAAILSQLAGASSNRSNRAMACCKLPHYDPKTGRVDRGVSCAGCQRAYDVEPGDDVLGRWAEEIRREVYSRDQFLEHFRWCKHAQLLWEESRHGLEEPDLPISVEMRKDGCIRW